MPKNKNKFEKKILLINLMTLMLGLQLGLILYVISTFLATRVGEKNVSWIFLLGYIISFYILIKLHTLVRKFGNSQTFFIFGVMSWISLIGMGAFWFNHVSVIFAVLFLAGGSSLWATLDVLLERYSNDDTTGKTRGLYLTILNFGVLVAPFFSAWLVQAYENGYQLVFYLASFFTLIPLIILVIFFSKRDANVKLRKRNFSLTKTLLVRKNVLRIYWVSFLLDLFYAVMVVYTPVYLLSIGLSWLDIGKIFTVMLIPFVVLQYPLGILADKKTGEKFWLIFSLMLMAIFTIAIGFVKIPDVGIWMTILLFTRIGAAIVEIMRDTYFYKKIGPKDVELMDFFRTSRSLSYMIGMPIFIGLLLVFPLHLNYVFILLGTILGLGIIPLFRLKDTEVSR
jgi:MFS family permease